MAAPIYATLTDLRAWAQDENADIPAVLFARASRVIDEALFGAVYQVNPTTQLATDLDIQDAIRDATCAQAQWMDAVGDTDGTGAVQTVGSASIGSVSYSNISRPEAAGRSRTGADLAPAAVRDLQAAGLRTVVFVHG